MNKMTIDRKPIFDEVRRLIGRGFSREEVARIDRAIDRALGMLAGVVRRLGSLSERFESGGRGPGAVSGGQGDPGGVSYGIYQMASRTGTAGAFMAAEGAAWAAEFSGAVPGSEAFSRIWRAIAEREPERFVLAQHAFIERTHYRPAVDRVRAQTGLDLDVRAEAVRDVAWSVAVQHGGAATILKAAVAQADGNASREDAGYDRALIEAIYAHRTAYVLRVAQRSGAAARITLEAITRSRYPAERAAALAMLDGPALTA